jgi:L-amino acid N-acyltransferase YncA
MTMLRWSWPTNLASWEDDLGDMLAGSVADDGILGYATEVTPGERKGFADSLAWQVAQGSGHVLLGQDADGIAAMCVMKTNSMPNCRHIAEVSKAYLRPRVRGTSAVYQLAEAVCARAAQLGVELLAIDVREDSKAHRVWTKLGFTTYGILDDYARVDGRSYRGHYMRHRTSDLAAIVATALRDRDNQGGSRDGR